MNNNTNMEITMFTKLHEFFFSNHYLYDNDNRFTKRIKEVKCLNISKNQEKMNSRLKQVLYYLGLEQLDKKSSVLNSIGIVFGNLYFKEEGRLKPAELQIEGARIGNVYVAVIMDLTVVTIKLFPITISNQEILDNLNKDVTTIKQLVHLNSNNPIDLTTKKRDIITIDLDISDAEFDKIWPIAVLKNNIK